MESCSFRTRKEEQASKNVDWSNQLKHSRKKHTALLNLTSQVGTPRQRNPPAPKVPRRNSVGVEGNQTDLSDWYSFPAASKCAVSIQHGRNIGSTWSQLRPTRPQLRSNLDPPGSNFGPTWLQDGAAWPQQVGPIWEQFRPKLRPTWLQNWDMAGPIRNPQNVRCHWCFPRFLGLGDASCCAMFPILCLRWA